MFDTELLKDIGYIVWYIGKDIRQLKAILEPVNLSFFKPFESYGNVSISNLVDLSPQTGDVGSRGGAASGTGSGVQLAEKVVEVNNSLWKLTYFWGLQLDLWFYFLMQL